MVPCSRPGGTLDSLCTANGAAAKVARDGWPGKTPLLNGQSMGTKARDRQREIHCVQSASLQKLTIPFKQQMEITAKICS